MANISANWNANGQRFNTASDVYYTAVKNAVTVYKGSLLESVSGENTITFAANTASASFMGVAGEQLAGDGTTRASHYVNGDFEFLASGTTPTVGIEVYAGANPKTVQLDTSTGPKVGKVVRVLSTGNVIISIDGYANV